MKRGTQVRLTEEAKALLGRTSAEHVAEFGGCVGIVQGLTDFGTQLGPEVDVCWQPSNLRYAYDPDWLEVVG